MKIGFILLNNHGGKGGMESVLTTVVNGLKKQEIKSYIYLLYRPKHVDFLNNFDHTFCLPTPEIITRKAFWIPKFIHKWCHKKYIQNHYYLILEKIKQDQIDLLIVLNLTKQFTNHLPLLKAVKQQLHIPLLSWTHSSISNISKTLQKKIHQNISIFSGHLAISQGIKKELETLYQQSNIYLIYNPIQIVPLIPRNPRKLLFIGRIDENKQLPQLLQVLKNVSGEWSLDIIGSTGSYKYDLQLQNYIKQLELSNKIHFLGWQESPWDCVDSAGLLLLNSKIEGFSLVIAEAMMRGIPALSADCPVGPGEIIQDGINGWLYPMNEYDHCQNILQSILNETRPLPNPTVVQQSVQHFSSDTVIQNFIKVLKKIIIEKR